MYALNEQLFGVFLFSSLALCPHAYCYTLLWSQKSEFFPEILLLFNRSMSEILFTLHHSYVRRKILFTLYGWGNTNPSGFCSVVLQVTQDVVFHFRSSGCSLLLDLLMQNTFTDHTCINWASRRDTVKDRGWFSWFPDIPQNFCGRERNKNAVLHHSFFVGFCFCFFMWFFFFFVGLFMIIMRLFSFCSFSLVFSLLCV